MEYRIKTNGKAPDAAIVKGDKYRFTVLTPRLIRIEYNENGEFEDRATQAVISRDFDTPGFSVEDNGGIIKIKTEFVHIEYTKEPFSEYSLVVKTVADGIVFNTWRYNEEQKTNLKGTVRTLDGVNGACDLDNGIMSRTAAPILYDDSESLILTDDGSVEPREKIYKDQYLFCYGILPNCFDCGAALADFYKLCGGTPLIPRYALGNWWSRYHAYTQEEYLSLMERFEKEEIPFSVAVIDMDWHKVKIDPKYGSGWTGYSWNRELFPEPKEFLKELHDKGLAVSLNLHPADGVRAHEDMYEEMATAMGIDPESKEPVEFDIADPKFIENYFKIIHHPMEEDGVDFWWIDWQQGGFTKTKGLDPLWMLNHFHYIDNARKGGRPLILSRYSGVGAHRYPLGFSGDTIISWESLDFQPYFTANASNIGYSWWSHDIGGHMGGCKDDELTARWVQLGVFSPINRLHSTNNIFSGKEPWNYEKNAEHSIKKFLKLRHELIPYMYSMNYRSYKYSEPLVKPLYYTWQKREAYWHKNEYTFGTGMLVSPVTKPCDTKTVMGYSETYIPEGMWYDLFTNQRYMGCKRLRTFRELDNMPVFIKAGGIIPMASLSRVNDTSNPENMKIKVYAGADGEFELYEDDGVSMDYEKGKFAITKMKFEFKDKPQFTLFAPEGDASVIPGIRNYEIEFIGIENNTDIKVTENGAEKKFNAEYSNGVLTVKTENVSGELDISFMSKVSLKPNDIKTRLFDILNASRINNRLKQVVYETVTQADSVINALSDVYAIDGLDENIKYAAAEILTAEIERKGKNGYANMLC